MREFFLLKSFAVVHGIGFHFDAKYAAFKKIPLYPYISIAYRQLQNNDFNYAYIDSNSLKSGYPLGGSEVINDRVPGGSFLAIRDFSIGIGLQYYLANRKPILPFVGFEIDYHRIWGLYYQTPFSAFVAGNNPTGTTSFKINPGNRWGIGFDAGFDFRISTNVGFVFGTKFKLANLIGKQSEKTLPASQNPGDMNSMNLLDAAGADLNTNLSSDRQINYFEFYLGFSIFVGKK